MVDLTPYRRLLWAQVRSQAQYRTSFVLELVSSALSGALDLIGVLVLFRVTRTVGGFDFRAVLLMASLSGLAFALADAVVGSIERIQTYVRTGTLDAVLVRPLGALPQLLATDVAPKRLGRVGFTAAVLAVAAHQAGIDWTPARAALVVVTPVAGAVLFGAIFVTSATVAFWWIDSGEFANAVTYGGRDFTAYPMTVYVGDLFRWVFAYGLGFAFVGYYPALALLGRPDPLGLPGWAGWLTPVVAVGGAALAATMWKFAIRHYRSTGS